VQRQRNLRLATILIQRTRRRNNRFGEGEPLSLIGCKRVSQAAKQQLTQSGQAVFPRGMDLLDTPLLNKGTAFTEEERNRFGLHGLLPPHIEMLEEQVVRAYDACQQEENDLERHIYLRALQDTNEVLFYRLLLDHIEEMTPIVYPPVVGQAYQLFSHIYRRPARAIYFLPAA
jgi:hypothetical protein